MKGEEMFVGRKILSVVFIICVFLSGITAANGNNGFFDHYV